MSFYCQQLFFIFFKGTGWMTLCFSGHPVKPACIYLFIYLLTLWWSLWLQLVLVCCFVFFCSCSLSIYPSSHLLHHQSTTIKQSNGHWMSSHSAVKSPHWQCDTPLWCCFMLIQVSWLLTSRPAGNETAKLHPFLLPWALWLRLSAAWLNSLCNNSSTLMWTQQVALALVSAILLHL